MANRRLLYSDEATIWLRDGATRGGRARLDTGGAVLEDRIKVGQVERVDAFHAIELGCNVALLSQPGLHVLPSERRTRPGWGGYTVPILALSTQGGGVVSTRPDLLERVRSALGPPPPERPLGVPDFARLQHVARISVPYAYSLSGFVLYADRDHFRPITSRRAPDRARRSARYGPAAALRRRDLRHLVGAGRDRKLVGDQAEVGRRLGDRGGDRGAIPGPGPREGGRLGGDGVHPR